MGNGGIQQLGPATLAFKNKHENLVYPSFPTSVRPKHCVETDLSTNVYPNPVFDNKFTVEVTDDLLNGELHIYNPMGILVESKKITETHSEISLKDELPKGCYYIKFLHCNVHKENKLLLF